MHQTSVIVGCQQYCRVFRKTAPLTTFHQVDIVYLYIGQHNNICFFSPFRLKGPFSPTFCKHANFSEEVARRILNSEFLTVRFLFRKDHERGVFFSNITNSNMTWFFSPIKSTDTNSALFPDISALAHWQ